MAHATPTGKPAQSTTTPTPGKTTTTPTPSATTGNDKYSKLSQAAKYALAKQVPDLAVRGCVITTSYGDIVINPGYLCDRLISLLVREITRGRLL